MRNLLLVCVAAALAVTFAAPAADLITSLPGWTGPFPSAQYSGYLDITSSKHLHYWLVLSESNPATAPTVLWLNGGPGCSSLDGFIYEHGPFEVDPSNYSHLLLRDYRWSSQANVLYIESPVGVGFSYSDNPAVDYNCNDDQTANDNLAAMEVFFQKFPEYVGNPLYLTGESYAGIYIPTLAEAIIKAGSSYKGAALKGIAVGNGCSGDTIGICGHGVQGTCYEWTYLTQLGFIPTDLKASINKACNWTAACANIQGSLSVQCEELLGTASAEISNVNMYNVYGDCVNSYLDDVRPMKAPHNSAFLKGIVGGPDACIDSRAATGYFSQSSVQQAIHVKYPGFTWGVCTTASGWRYTSTRQNLPRDTYPLLISNIRVTIYNGDWDACVPYTDNEAWTEGMGFPVSKGWHAWYYTSEAGAANQVAGYAVKYTVTGGSFEFITVRGGRHEVPETAPGKAAEMLRRVISNQDF
jgi:carboxypeptidase C (cathepsin A)